MPLSCPCPCVQEELHASERLHAVPMQGCPRNRVGHHAVAHMCAGATSGSSSMHIIVPSECCTRLAGGACALVRCSAAAMVAAVPGAM